MTALPIVVRELRVAARRNSTYWTRLSVAFASIFFGGYALFVTQGLPQITGVALFSTFSWIGLLYCVSVGLRNSADCMSQEKREGTLGLLFLTDLKGYDIVLGKLAVAGIHSFYGFMAAFPVFSISLMLGGVTGAQFLKTALALMNIFLFAHAVGLLVSTFSLHARKAYAYALALALLFLIVLPSLASLEAISNHNQIKAEWLQLLSPGTPFVLAQETMGIKNTGTSTQYWLSLLITHCISWGFLGLASWRAPHCWQDRPTVQRLRWRERLDTWTRGNSETRKQFRYKLAQINPFFWLISRNRLAPYTVWIGLGLGFCLWVWFWFKDWRSTGSNWQIPVFITTIAIMHTLFKFLVASEASRHFDEQRRDGSLEFLLSCTPLKVSEILAGHWLALKRHFLWPMITILSLDFLMLIGITTSVHSNTDRAYSSLVVITAMIVLVVDTFALGWVGMWLGLSMKKPRRAAGGAVSRILFLPWILFWFLAMFSRGFGSEFGAALIIWLIIALLNSYIFWTRAKTQLNSQFRELATPQVTENHGTFEKIGRTLGTMAGNLTRNS